RQRSGVVNESEWLACTHRKKMLSFLWGKASERKLRLFSCACCRRIWRLLSDDKSRRAVEVAEAFADGAALPSQRFEYKKDAEVVCDGAFTQWRRAAAYAAAYALDDDLGIAAWWGSHFSAVAVRKKERTPETHFQSNLL